MYTILTHILYATSFNHIRQRKTTCNVDYNNFTNGKMHACIHVWAKGKNFIPYKRGIVLIMYIEQYISTLINTLWLSKNKFIISTTN